ncbi:MULTISPECIES: purine-nucleoside phosphorylase [Brevibacillus]|uniref:purine-nucleoside phosphorylase n=1 Tax=Brevibacillus TaxID=55080 RepID=UPI000F077A47|nr:purine-nucleoside phosphorylase [Brevibacillus borstelensis]MBE5397705.1 purine-nucleoside phosphorylase [Brevibacillus borstelensis]MED1875001.1 purine-nucleoside phosphorylase [Brevibacillus borstelensis]MED1882503.1 purine-nucleoside phosphorylase [Brevibacillus borstelensis]RNB62341.1 purine-nucleoside phosphorylase [Brevibacillus borstelensis]GED51770.1 purine nucleoside phosphorylase [Brevibacillus borstelensis]
MTTYQDAIRYIEPKLSEKPTIGLVLGSGLGVLADEIENPVIIPYHEIPGFTVSTVVGHKGQLVIGKLQGKQVVAMQGRFHYYEGHGLDAVVFPIRVMKMLGVETIIVTNAAGGINENYQPGNLMLIADHINMTFRNPLIGPNDEQLGARFPDMSEAYSKALRGLAKEVAAEQGIELQEGVYVGLLGPSYETPAEIRMLRILGGDAVGMSTVPEVIVAKHMKMNVLGISCISNMAAGILEQPLSHEEVMETTEKVKAQFLSLINGIVAKL